MPNDECSLRAVLQAHLPSISYASQVRNASRRITSATIGGELTCWNYCAE